MSSILEQITKQLGSGGMQEISRALGADEERTSQAASLALPAILGALSRNSSQEDGAQALSNALAKDHDGSVFDNLSSLFGKPETGPGEGILRHVLGDR